LVLFLFIIKTQILNYNYFKSRLNTGWFKKLRHSSNSDITFFMCGFETKDGKNSCTPFSITGEEILHAFKSRLVIYKKNCN
jgi:hypothetical protein